jgi:hypothetical protein
MVKTDNKVSLDKKLNKMKKTTSLLIIFFGLTIFSYGQNCEYLTNEKDEFTNAMKLETWGKLIREFTGSNANLILRKIDTTYYLLLNYNVQYAKAMVAGTNDLLMFKLENDSVLYFKPTEITSGNLNTSAGITTTQIKINYFATKDQIVMLSKYGIKKVRVYFTDGYKEHETKEKNANEIKTAAYCLLD